MSVALVSVQFVYRCAHPNCPNTVSVWPLFPMHGGWEQLYAAMRAFPTFKSSAEFAGARNEFSERPVKA